MRHELFFASALAMLVCGNAWSQATVKQDGQWRSAAGLGYSVASGNVRSSNLNITGDAVKATTANKWQVYGNVLRASASGTTTSEIYKLGTRYDLNLAENYFAFALADAERNRFANLSSRFAVGSGLGYHMIRSDPLSWDVFGGLGYASDRYITTTVVNDSSRDTYSRVEILLGEESNHRLTPTTSFRQRFVIYPNVSNSGSFRSTLDASLAVAMSSAMSLTLTVGHRYNSDPGTDFKKSDLLLFTGVNVKYD